MECIDTFQTAHAEDDLSIIEVSVVMPCLNEADTLRVCIEKAQRALRDNDIAREIIIADNGSSDGSAFIALSMSARLVSVTERGDGHDLMGGSAAARGKCIVLRDADERVACLA